MRLLLGLAIFSVIAGRIAANSVVIGAIGDYGSSGSASQDVASMVKSWGPDLIITLGDNNYGFASDYDRLVGSLYHSLIYPYSGIYGESAVSNRFFPSLGNHDSWNDSYRNAYTTFFTLPGNERYYNFQYGPIEFFAVNSEVPEPDGIAPDALQGQWLQTQLAASTAPWRLVYFHTPPYSSGPHGFYNEGLRMRWPFAEWGATAILSGHDHIYERLFTNNLVHFVNGLGGASRYGIYTNLHAGSQLQYNANYGAMRIEATDSNIVFEFITIAGEIIDSVVMGSSPSRGLRILYSSGDQSVCLSNNAVFRVSAIGAGTLRYQWYFNGEPFPQTNSTFTITNAGPQHHGQYHVVVSDDVETLVSHPGTLSIRERPSIITQPENETAVATSNATFTVSATGCGALRYQWQHAGTNLPKATNATLVVTNVQSQQAGEYRALVSDVNASVFSDPAVLEVLFPARFAEQPISQSAVEGDDVTFSVASTGTLPMTYEWRFGSITRLTNIVRDENICFFTLRNVQLSQAGSYRVGLSNVLGRGPASGFSTLTVLADSDHDGLSDAWESSYGFPTNDASNASLDSDGDQMSNRAEYLAGTNPTNSESFLKIELKIDSRTVLQFGAVSGKTYTIEYSDTLPPVSWAKFVDVIGRTNDHIETIPDPDWSPRRFYRLATPRQP